MPENKPNNADKKPMSFSERRELLRKKHLEHAAALGINTEQEYISIQLDTEAAAKGISSEKDTIQTEPTTKDNVRDTQQMPTLTAEQLVEQTKDSDNDK